ncbi:MAG: hypothetical protein ACI834_000626, partial [Colwellia sp.]
QADAALETQENSSLDKTENTEKLAAVDTPTDAANAINE